MQSHGIFSLIFVTFTGIFLSPFRYVYQIPTPRVLLSSNPLNFDLCGALNGVVPVEITSAFGLVLKMFWYVYGALLLIAHIPITVDVVRLVRPGWKISRPVHSLQMYLLIIVVGVIFCVVLWHHLAIFLPLIAGSTLSIVLHVVFALWIWVNAIVHYYLALFIHPGLDKSLTLEGAADQNGPKVTTESYDGDAVSIRSRSAGLTNQKSVESLIPKPQDGMEWKPNRISFCRVCHSHIPHMDHHCPYTGSCFGVRNYAHFYLGMCYGLLGALYASLISAPFFFRCDVKYLLMYINLIGGELSVECEQLGTQSRAFLPVLAGTWIALNLVVIQTLLLLADVSTINALKNINSVPLLKFLLQRIKGRKFLQPDSRLNTLILNQRPSILYYLLPLRNRKHRMSVFVC